MNIQPEEWRHNSICSLYAGKRWQRIAACPSLRPALSGLTGLLLQSEKKNVFHVLLLNTVTQRILFLFFLLCGRWLSNRKELDIVWPARHLWA